MKNNTFLVVYHHHLTSNASTIMENVTAFQKYANKTVFTLNTELGCPSNISSIQFDIIILHYSLFGRGSVYEINQKLLNYIKLSDAFKIAFFQDEYHYCQKRFNFLNEYKIDSVYTLLDPKYFEETYYKYSNVKEVHPTLTGYVDQALIDTANKFFMPFDQRTIDISYRSRELPYYMGKEAQEKVDIAKEFLIRLDNSNLALDIGYTESSRIYGDAWHKLIANSRAVIGVEAGVSIFDIDGKAFEIYQKALKENQSISKEAIFTLLEPWEGIIHYRTISPRVFEAAAFKVCQILFEGDYQGILKPMVHYIPLKKDFSNFDKVIEMLQDSNLVSKIIDNAYNDLILSGDYSYKKFIENFENNLPLTMQSKTCNYDSNTISELLLADYNYRYFVAKLKSIRYKQFPGRKTLVRVVKFFLQLKGKF